MWSQMMAKGGWRLFGVLAAALALAGCRPSQASSGGAARAEPAQLRPGVARGAGDLRPAARPLPRPAAEGVIAHEVTFGSLEWASGLPRTIRLHGFLVKPVDNEETGFRPGDRR